MTPTTLQIIILALIQGAAELLPVSSSAHVIVAEKLMRLDASSPETTFLLVMLHTGTMLATVVYFRKAWCRTFLSSWPSFVSAATRIACATAATVLVGYALKFLIEKVVLGDRAGAAVEDLFSSLHLIAASLAAAGLVILAAGMRARSVDTVAASASPGIETLRQAPALWVGLVQGLCLPLRGFSRSGATISAGMLLGVPRRLAEEFSFALGVVITPAVVGVELRRLLRAHASDAGGVHLLALAMPGLLGVFWSFAAGLVALRWLSGWLENGRWHYFGYYCLAAAAGICVLAGMGY